jgi:5-methylcytosine-specific restriction protein A
MKNPKWHRDEIILALDLYFELEPGHINARNPEIVRLSEILNKLPIHEERPDKVKFRNPNSVRLKLSNFLAIDPDYHGKGMASYSRLDKAVFDEFYNDKTELKRIANKIKRIALDPGLSLKLYEIKDDEGEDSFSVREGKVIYKLHKHIERNNIINNKKKEFYFKKYGKLNCEVCRFDFKEFYGNIGDGFIECHHIKPLSELNNETETALNDLALVCSNCHRMLHRNLNALSIEDLKDRIKNI